MGVAWLTEVFEKHIKDRTRGVYRLLILDGHGSHTSPEFDLFCSEHIIITLCMPPHSSHLLQPLDVSCYAVLKQSYGRQVEEYMRVGVNHIDKPDFLMAYVSARREAIIPDIICSGFAATGLVPYNPDRVLAKLNTQLRTPTPPLIPPCEQGHWSPETPYNVAQLELQAKAIKEHLSHRIDSPPSPTNQILNQLVKGCQLAMNNAILLTEVNKQLRATNERQKRKRARREYIATGGILTIQEGLGRSQTTRPEPESGVVNQTAVVQMRAPRMCSVCRSLEHTACTCPQRNIFS